MPQCRNCERILIEDATFCPSCSLENPLEFQHVKKKISLNSFSFFSTALFWLWAVPLWILLWFVLGMFVSSGILCVLVIFRTISEFVDSQETFDDWELNFRSSKTLGVICDRLWIIGHNRHCVCRWITYRIIYCCRIY